MNKRTVAILLVIAVLCAILLPSCAVTAEDAKNSNTQADEPVNYPDETDAAEAEKIKLSDMKTWELVKYLDEADADVPVDMDLHDLRSYIVMYENDSDQGGDEDSANAEYLSKLKDAVKGFDGVRIEPASEKVKLSDMKADELEKYLDGAGIGMPEDMDIDALKSCIIIYENKPDYGGYEVSPNAEYLLKLRDAVKDYSSGIARVELRFGADGNDTKLSEMKDWELLKYIEESGASIPLDMKIDFIRQYVVLFEEDPSMSAAISNASGKFFLDAVKRSVNAYYGIE